MATNHTQNYQLNLWEPTDRFLRSEFNENTEKIDAALGGLSAALTAKGNCQIVTGTYTGNGGAGNNNPVVLNFDKPPLMIAILGLNYRALFVQGASRSCAALPSGGYELNVTWSGNSVSFYCSGHLSEAQMNAKDTTYYYVALFQQ